MSTHFKTSLLGASAIIAASAVPAYAQVVAPAAELHAAGATSIQDIMPRELNCIGDYNADLTKNNSFNVPSGTTAFAVRSAVRTAGSTAKFDCATANIQPNITLKYLAVGSSGGRNGLVAVAGSATRTAILGSNTKPDAAIFGTDTDTWTKTHFAMSDAPLTAGNVSSWTSNRPAGAGALIQIPLFVLPVSVVYSPIYGYKTGGVKLTFNVKTSTATGGLRLSKQAYCGIFNGNIRNWNHFEIQRSNTTDTAYKKTGQVAGTPLFDTSNDTSTRWAAEGAPIRLVGRLDGSGTTDIFTRHLATTCQGPITQLIGAPKITQAAEQLPYNPASGINMAATSGTPAVTVTGGLSSARYIPTGAGTTASNFAGSTTMISGAAYAGTSGIVTVSGGGEVITPAANGTNGSGLYILANGGGNVVAAIADARDNAGVLITSFDGDIKFNGKIGYASSDTVVSNTAPISNEPTMTLATAALETGYTYDLGKGKKWSFLEPTAANAVLAFGGVLPPESNAKGAFVAGAPTDLQRSNPLHWYDALYANLSTLANPLKGYAITGTTQLITGTCFADPSVRNAMVTMLRTMTGVNLVNSIGKGFDKNLFLGIKSTALSLRGQSALAPLPASWTFAIRDTFLQKSKDAGLAAKGLWIQNAMPTEKSFAAKTAKGYAVKTTDWAAIDARALPAVGDNLGAGNPACTTGTGIPTL